MTGPPVSQRRTAGKPFESSLDRALLKSCGHCWQPKYQHDSPRATMARWHWDIGGASVWSLYERTPVMHEICRTLLPNFGAGAAELTGSTAAFGEELR